MPPSRPVSTGSNVTDANGQATFNVTDSTAETVTLTATDTTDSLTLTHTAQATFATPTVNQSVSTSHRQPDPGGKRRHDRLDHHRGAVRQLGPRLRRPPIAGSGPSSLAAVGGSSVIAPAIDRFQCDRLEWGRRPSR